MGELIRVRLHLYTRSLHLYTAPSWYPGHKPTRPARRLAIDPVAAAPNTDGVQGVHLRHVPGGGAERAPPAAAERVFNPMFNPVKVHGGENEGGPSCHTIFSCECGKCVRFPPPRKARPAPPRLDPPGGRPAGPLPSPWIALWEPPWGG